MVDCCSTVMQRGYEIDWKSAHASICLWNILASLKESAKGTLDLCNNHKCDGYFYPLLLCTRKYLKRCKCATRKKGLCRCTNFCVRSLFSQVSTTLRLISLTSAPVPDLSKSMPPFNVIINDLSESLKKAPRHAFYYVMTKSFNCKDVVVPRTYGVITHFTAIRK